MLHVKVLGAGCSNCQRLHQTVVDAAQILGVDANVEKVTDVTQFQKYRLLATPGLVVNEKLVCAGRVPDQAEVMTFLSTALAEPPSASA